MPASGVLNKLRQLRDVLWSGTPDDGQVLTWRTTDGKASFQDPTGGGSDDQTAAEVPFTPAGNLAADDVQAAIEELDTEKAATSHTHAGEDITSGTVADARIASTIARDSEVTSAISTSEAGQVRDGDAAGGVLAGTYPNPSFASDMATQAELDAHVNDTSDAHDASAISVLDTAGDFTATDVEGALAELQSDAEADAQALADHLADTADAHDASAISILDAGNDFTATDVEGALAELQADAEAHLADTSDAHDASAISVADSGGNYTATDVEGVLAEIAPQLGGGSSDLPVGAMVLVWPQFAFASLAGTFVTVLDGNQWCGIYVQNTATHAQNDEIQLASVYLGPGDWVADCYGICGSDRAIWTIRLAGSDVATADFYTASLAFNKKVTSSSFTVSTGGTKTLSVKAATKNAAGTDYYLTMSLLVFRRIA